ncbi:MAG: mechanosensitive ion channel, partial [Flavobacteriales bacterium]|nr:mechanosensitive ion channel [Flavobacteriales bacterium]
MEFLKSLLEFEIISVGQYKLDTVTLLLVVLIFVITKLLLWLIKKSVLNQKRYMHLDEGTIYSIFQIVKYIVWIVAVAFMLEMIGVKVTLIIAGSAALLVGVGLGLQQTFNDVISGIILLSERTIKIDDVLEIDGDIVMIQEIGLRTSKGLNRDDISIIIPNSLITTNKVINWSHQSKKARFKIDVGVAYGSDINLVLKILEESAFSHPDIFDRELTEARLMNFGNSSLDFQVLFFSKSIFRISKVKSDIRRIIYTKFLEHNITIPFPQMDVHVKSGKG